MITPHADGLDIGSTLCIAATFRFEGKRDRLLHVIIMYQMLSTSKHRPGTSR